MRTERKMTMNAKMKEYSIKTLLFKIIYTMELAYEYSFWLRTLCTIGLFAIITRSDNIFFSWIGILGIFASPVLQIFLKTFMFIIYDILADIFFKDIESAAPWQFWFWLDRKWDQFFRFGNYVRYTNNFRYRDAAFNETENTAGFAENQKKRTNTKKKTYTYRTHMEHERRKAYNRSNTQSQPISAEDLELRNALKFYGYNSIREVTEADLTKKWKAKAKIAHPDEVLFQTASDGNNKVPSITDVNRYRDILKQHI